ncbi:Digestive organ expansion factor [Phytophthora megakarya]|uniref:Digestive organ expansion factor n=1 Tax=Phytophthora megakarya TaxID=4795 RepID=A0A225WNA2_9STRA|nr:Digestive organ expansion factor [Phytophthora megakarya]
MGPRKGGGKKGSRKRKANVWDDAVPKTKGSAISSENERKPRRNGSMMGQWKSQKIAERTKERKFFASVDEKKRLQREQYEDTWERAANAIYKDGSDEGEEEEQEVVQSEESDSDEDALERPKNSIFQEFVHTFKAAEPVEEDEEEEEYEEVVVDENGEEIGEEETEPVEEMEEIEDGKEDEEQIAAMEKDDQEQVEKEDEEQEDPYRRRYLLSSFTEQEAKRFDAQTRKFSKVTLPALQEEEYDVSYRNGVDADVSRVANIVTTPETAERRNPYVRSRLLATWKQRRLDTETVFPKGSVERNLSQQVAAYTDVIFAGQTYENTASLRRLSAMHVLNHVLKARDTVTRNNERIKKRDAGKDEEHGDDEEKEYRDQGFCRASVLMLLPLRSAAMAFVKQLLELLPANMDTFHNKDRFFSEFGSVKDEDDDSSNNDDNKEWQRVFDEGNNDDCFQLGLSFSRKAVRFYSEYHHADIIIASPLGLRQQLGDEVAVLDEAETTADVKLSSDFLSTIEVCIIDSASLMAMQNLEHLRTVLRATNLQPKEAPNADFSRVREWNLAFLASYFRQTVMFSHGVEPALNALVNRTCRNISGLVKYVRRYDAADGSASIARVVPQVKQIFQRVDMDHNGRLTAKDEVELRFAYFKKHVFEPLLDHPRKHVLIFIPSYFDYVRVRNLFNDSMNKKLIRTAQCCEYTTSKQVSRARTSFFHGHCHVMLYTERFHFYHQYQIRGVHQLIWYGLPMMGDFYAEMMNMLPNSDSENHNDDALVDTTDGKSSIALFTRLDLLRMQRIVGNKRAERMCQAKATKPTFLFC